jgi:hypothetical protein
MMDFLMSSLGSERDWIKTSQIQGSLDFTISAMTFEREFLSFASRMVFRALSAAFFFRDLFAAGFGDDFSASGNKYPVFLLAI